MPATITWTITAMDCYPQAEGETDVVFCCHWTCSGTQQSGDQTFNAAQYSTCSVTYVGGTQFTPYDDLTQDQVLGWVWSSGVDKMATEAAVQQQIDAEMNPTTVTPPLPWAA